MAPAAKTHKAVLQVLQSAKPKLRKAILDNSDRALVYAICEICDNLLRGNIPISESHKVKLRRHRDTIRQLAQRGEGWQVKKKTLEQTGGSFLPLLLTAVASVLPSLFQ
ncbi:ATP-dependent Clp protease adapter protein ClpS 2 [Frankliniella fusca]|uniref:ATP-dependent Clp protease adapter protein ClpS 2 n=1 Tax=Frankliniella fusca TaxID=407009 RepID=A0AAE1GUB6_9NEOP|nr:ATP-dependent Clp protease adapter protein ClpS 2 [Frankliniella fusca]KAK3914281.1 ATP-dependent Clp protease adapter protein ClpS 2 [Frankliniella fusca]